MALPPALPQMEAQPLGLLELPTIIFRMILEQLYGESPQAVYDFRLVCRVCREHSEPLVFRDITLSDASETTRWFSSQALGRLKNPRDPLAQCVRHFRIGPFSGGSETQLSEDDVLLVLSRIDNLQSLSWNINEYVPKSVLDHLSSRSPLARLFVRGQYPPLRPIDERVLSSPLLHCLDIIASHRDFRKFSKCLLQAQNLKVLRLATTFSQSTQSYQESGHWQLELHPGDVLPSLEELALPHDEYDLSETHCKVWKNCMNWSGLRKLDLGKGTPLHLLDALTGQVPQLKSLRLGLWTEFRSHEITFSSWGSPGRSEVARFLRSIDALEELGFFADTFISYGDASCVVWSTLSKQHGASLRTLTVECSESQYWAPRNLEDLQRNFANLETLEVDIALTNAGNWPRRTTPILSRFEHIRLLRLTVTPQKSCSLLKIRKNSATINADAAEQIATGLFKEYLSKSKQPQIEEIHLRVVCRWAWKYGQGNDSTLTVAVKNLHGAEKGKPKFSVQKGLVPSAKIQQRRF